MKSLFLLVAFIAISIYAVSADGDVVVLTDSTFDAQTASGDWFLEFYAPWCGHCKKLTPIYDELATKLKGTVNVGKTDCTVEKATCERFGIRGYPTIKFLKGGKLYDYSDARTVDAFVKYSENTFDPASGKELPAQGAPKETRDAPAQAAVPAAASTGGSDVVVLTKDNFDSLTAKGEWLLEFYAPWCGHCKSLAPVYEQLATSVKGKYNVGKVDCTVEESLASRFNVKGYPTIKFLKGGKLYDYKGARVADAFTSFMESGYSSAQSTDFGKEAVANEDVVVLTDATFDQSISKGNWLVEFYAPWCGHCKRLAPVFEELGKASKLANTKITSESNKVHIGKVDCTKEKGTCSRFGVRGYPTIHFFRDNLRYEFDGERTVEAFQEFVKTGYQKVTGQSNERSALRDTISDVVKTVEEGLKMNIFVVIGICIAAGVLLGLLIVVLTIPKDPAPRAPQAKTGTAKIEEIEEDEDEDEDTKKDK